MTDYISFEQTGYFSKIALDYSAKAHLLQPFYTHEVSLEGIKASIAARKKFPQSRAVLVKSFEKQYENVEQIDAVENNIQLLKKDATFTVTTAHQPNIFTGPLYFLYKIAHVIRLSQYLKEGFPEYDFVPVYYMGSEDADLDEIGQFTVHGKKYIWRTTQTGAVGRMIVDKPLLELLAELKGQVDVEQYGSELTTLFEKYYTIGKPIQEATLEIVNALFGKYGLVVLIPDNAELKKLFEPVIVKELTEQFSHSIVEKTAQQIATIQIIFVIICPRMIINTTINRITY